MPPIASDPPLIDIRNVCKSFTEGGHERVVLHEASAQIRRGESVALLGRSGSGKSTLLNILSAIDAPTSGEIVIDGVALHRLNERDRTLFRRRNIGFVFQFFNLIPTLTVAENVLLPVELNGPVSAARRAGVDELLRRVGLGDRGGAFPDKLSGGEQQRVAIARALAHDPPLVLADEPTGNLDAHTGEQVLRLLDEMIRQAGKTLLMVTHSTEIAARADRVLHLEEGVLVERAAGVLV
ncbi:MAG TPA: ABC transporter ATP-binding protein [Herpetosiphonaceae bacterium]|nr:ABC transporter ATP-binding protein [Herpetosiphonaceae bacterium]